MNKLIGFAAYALFVSGALVGCNSPKPVAAQPPTAAPSSAMAAPQSAHAIASDGLTRGAETKVRLANGLESKVVLAKEMSAQQLQEHVGKPDEVRPFEAPEGHRAEVWVYRNRDLGTRIRHTEAETEMVPVYSVLDSNGYNYVQQPVLKQETTAFYEDVTVLLFDGKVVEWKRDVAAQRAYN